MAQLLSFRISISIPRAYWIKLKSVLQLQFSSPLYKTSIPPPSMEVAFISGLHHSSLSLQDTMTSDSGIGFAPVSPYNSNWMQYGRRKIPRPVTFFWGYKTEILFSGWPGTSSGMYALALIFVFTMAVLVEWLSYSDFIKQDDSNDVVATGLQTTLHTVRSGLSYMVMLAVMSFNGGVFLAAVGGHALGFLIFKNRTIRET
ncbi:putative Copper transporter [Quillaja saponaria]|uniref:Copper transport protein n=1 Tax=Quillaja saponaria TaxID=32244 RepID=A0AAD7PNP6_QUISA|nr:putative Copper transporter [Quillaja saponaria]